MLDLVAPFPLPALRMLLEVTEEAQRQGLPVWEFALELESLERAGATATQLRRTVCQGIIKHAEERTTSDSSQRVFHPLNSLSFPPRTCFVLTEAGVDYARRILRLETPASNPVPEPPSHPVPEGESPPEGNVPSWDRVRMELKWNGTTLKHFRRRAPNQQLLLDSFERNHWPWQLENPFDEVDDMDPTKWLRDTVRALNNSLEEKLVVFKVLESGGKVGWEASSIRGRQAPLTSATLRLATPT